MPKVVASALYGSLLEINTPTPYPRYTKLRILTKLQMIHMHIKVRAVPLYFQQAPNDTDGASPGHVLSSKAVERWLLNIAVIRITWEVQQSLIIQNGIESIFVDGTQTSVFFKNSPSDPACIQVYKLRICIGKFQNSFHYVKQIKKKLIYG